MKKKNANWFYTLLLIGSIFTLTNSCNKDNYEELPPDQTPIPHTPVIATFAVTYITPTSAICGGNISSDEGYAITAKGVCWSLGNNPTISDNKTVDGTGSDIFTSVVTN